MKIKPHAERYELGYLQLGVEVYGGALLHPWFDRDLSIAGRVHYLNARNQIQSCLIDFEAPIAILPSLAIHLDREANTQGAIQTQHHLFPVLLQQTTQQKQLQFKTILQQQLQKQADYDGVDILDYELFFYDTQPPALVGLKNEFITSARLDNLLSCYIGLMSLLDSTQTLPCLLACYDHEEVGSQSYCGAHGQFLNSVLQRICESTEKYERSLAKSWMISVDNAHATHPNYLEKHDLQHRIFLNQGPVIKFNANQRYATNSETSAFFRWLCASQEIPLQSFVMRNDLACGSTIGPITASQSSIKTLDVGVPQWGMHSVRETAGQKDAYFLYQALQSFLTTPH